MAYVRWNEYLIQPCSIQGQDGRWHPKARVLWEEGGRSYEKELYASDVLFEREEQANEYATDVLGLGWTKNQEQKYSALDFRRADASYRPFPPFKDWALNIDLAKWQRYAASLRELRSRASEEQRARALEIAKRAAAIETGAIEGLYQVDRGFTFTVATQAATWELALAHKGPHVLALFESQLKAYERIVDFATQHVPIAEAWIRALHAEICAPQQTYVAWTELGPQEIALPKGEYKHLPNHVVTKDGAIHSYAPVEMTGPEMYRLCEELRSESFAKAHPVIQASYAHYAFVVIHPFADGNGRVARALASVYTCRAESIPLLILADMKKEYFDSLASADEGHYQSFVDFVLERAVDALRLTEESLQAAFVASPEESLKRLQRLYVTKAGYSQEDVNRAGLALSDLFREELQHQVNTVQLGSVVSAQVDTPGVGLNPRPGYRAAPVHGVRIVLSSPAPSQASTGTIYGVLVPQDAGEDDDVILQSASVPNDIFTARIEDILPGPSSVLRMRARMKANAVFNSLLHTLATLASSTR